MDHRLSRLGLLVLVCLLALTAACGVPAAMETAPLPNSTPVPVQSDPPSVPTVRVPEQSGPPLTAYSPVTPDQGDFSPANGDVPALPPDEVTTLTYTVGEELITAPALRHYTLLGYAITYDTSLFRCNSFIEGNSYWHSEGNYLAVNLLMGLPMEDVLDGLRLQENIAMEPQSVTVGRESGEAFTLWLTAPNGIFRRFWAMPCGEDVLLVEQSYDTVADGAELLRAAQQAMLDTLLVFYY